MGKRRMFSLDVVDTDQFLDMGQNAQNLYFHLGMRADDDGFLASPRKVLRIAGCTDADLDELVSNGYVIRLEPGVIVITHWKIQNTIKKDRYTPTIYAEELKRLRCENGVYALEPDWNQSGTRVETEPFQDGTELEPESFQDVDKLVPQYKLSKEKKSNTAEQSSAEGVFTEIIAYLNQKTGKNFRSNCKATQRLVSARISEGFTVSDLKRVIDTKCEQWLNDTEHRKYLRPETLFSATHFESYLNEIPQSVIEEKREEPDEEEEVLDFWTE